MTNARLAIIHYKQGILSAVFEKNRMRYANFMSKNGSLVHNIYVGKIQNVVQNLNSAFIEFAPGRKCYLPCITEQNPVLLNRAYDGRLLAGDLILIQITKDAMKTKDPSATTNISLSGRLCVVTSGDRKIGYSDKLPRRHKEEIREQMPKEHPFGIIIRTNASEAIEEGHTDAVLREIEELTQKLQDLITHAQFRTCYSVLYEAPPMYLADIKNTYHHLYDTIITDDKDIYENIQHYLQENAPEELPKLKLYEDATYPLMKLYSIETRLQEALAPKVWLKSGAYLIIQPTEALVAVDVNSGKNISNKKNDEYIFEINKEAAFEIVNQLQLRNLSGMILIDFINMKKEYEEELMNFLRKLCKKDQVPTYVIDMTALGLVEVTRKKIRKSLWEQLRDGQSE